MKALAVVLAMTIVLESPPVQAHHFFATEYSRELTVTIEAVVTGIHFHNPHVRLDLLVMTERGERQVWAANSVSPNALSHRGWTEETITVGDRITLYGNLGSNESKRLWIQTLTLANGIAIYPVGRDPALDDSPTAN